MLNRFIPIPVEFGSNPRYGRFSIRFSSKRLVTYIHVNFLIATMKCQYCQEDISWIASVCPHCRTNFSDPNNGRPHNWQEYEDLATNGWRPSTHSSSSKEQYAKSQPKVAKYEKKENNEKKILQKLQPAAAVPVQKTEPTFINVALLFLISSAFIAVPISLIALFFSASTLVFYVIWIISSIFGLYVVKEEETKQRIDL